MDTQKNWDPKNPEAIDYCLEVLKNLNDDPRFFASLSMEKRIELIKLSGQIARPDRDLNKHRNKEIKRAQKRQIAQKEKEIRSYTGIREARKASVFQAPKLLTYGDNTHFVGELNSPRNCYVCKAEYKKIHFFYDSMCPSCAEFNYTKRFQSAPLFDRVALVTGARLKIGYHIGLKLLRAGAFVIATTRFPVDAAIRYSKEEDYSKWKDRLHIYGLDLRHTPSVEIFARYVEQTYSKLDFLVHNAAQTVRRPPAFYSHLLNEEFKPISELSDSAKVLLTSYETFKSKLNGSHLLEESDGTEKAVPVSWGTRIPGIGILSPAHLSQIPYTHDMSLPIEQIFPSGKLDADLQQVDLRKTNSWRLRLGEIPTAEMIELQLINAIAPFVLSNVLVEMMKKENTGDKHIVNVSAMEGKFYRFKKEDRHPHTNMAKAALNMLTHTAAGGLLPFGIHINSVDTGWVTDEDPIELAKQKQDVHDFQPPLDIVDGAARVLDPIFHGILTGEHWSGKFLKDYFPIEW
jgi:NAD(P)-dependent dehydrogenase (short-subunit alcohol dehydrogenase family)